MGVLGGVIEAVGTPVASGEGGLLVSTLRQLSLPSGGGILGILLSLLATSAGFRNVTLLAAIVTLQLFETARVWVVRAFASVAFPSYSGNSPWNAAIVSFILIANL